MLKLEAKKNVFNSELNAQIAAKHIPAASVKISGDICMPEVDGQYYLVKIRFEMLVEQMKKAQKTTEQLKAKKLMEWVGCVNSIRLQAMESINDEIIYN